MKQPAVIPIPSAAGISMAAPEEFPMSIRVEVDRSRCEGYGFCEQAAPELLRLDDQGELVIVQAEAPNDLAGKAQAAARLCPVAALRIVQ
jgi:ferredoxin